MKVFLTLPGFSEEKKNAVEQVAKDRNTHLSKHDPVRPFVSSFVANNMASELITLIHSLFTSSTANDTGIQCHQIICNATCSIPISELVTYSVTSMWLFTLQKFSIIIFSSQ